MSGPVPIRQRAIEPVAMSPGQASIDERFMVRALQLARRGQLTTDPNPCVGSVVVRDDRIVGEGWHRRAGGHHAEIEALEQAGPLARNATVYVTLEPCCHFGRTPPCTDRLIEAGVRRVVAAMEDPNPDVAGQGFRVLSEAGIDTAYGVLGAESESLNRGFCRRMRTGKPYVVSKLAMSLDGRTAMASGESKWITGDAARREVHRMRSRSSAILTGVNTVIADNPMLNARLDLGDDELIQPLRVILDSDLRIPPDAKIAREGEPPLILTVSSESVAVSRLERIGFRVVRLAGDGNGRLDLFRVMEYLGEVGVNELMVEAGAVLNGALLARGLVDEWVVFQAPSVLGHEARGLVHLAELRSMSDRYHLDLIDARAVGKDLRLRYRILNSVLADRAVDQSQP